jgi:hypothetical protein
MKKIISRLPAVLVLPEVEWLSRRAVADVKKPLAGTTCTQRMAPRLRTACALLLFLALPPMAQAQFNAETIDGAVTITGYTGPRGAVTIPSTINGLPVTDIGHNAFDYCSALTSVTIGSSVTNIADNAFAYCTSLTNVIILDGVTNIGDSAFSFCGKLASVYFLGNAPSVGANAFYPFYAPTVYYLPGTTGWGATFGSCLTMLLTNAVPALVIQPQGHAVDAGQSASFSVAATGTAPLSYQWLFNDGAIDGATTNSYGINNVQPADAGSYSVVVSNVAGSVTSAVALLAVQGPYTATATAIVVNDSVAGATITDGGYGYTNTPAARIIGDDCGSGAEAVAVVANGVVIAVNLLNSGSGYTNTPVIVIEPPFIPQPAIGIVPLPVIAGSTAQVFQLGIGGLSPYDNYQLQFTPVPGGVWTNFALPFISTTGVSTQNVVVSGNTGFFRVKYVP